MKPFVPRHWLYLLAGALWSLAGGILCLRAYGWLLAYQRTLALTAGSGGAAAAVVSYLFGFSRIAGKNIRRIDALPAQASIFAFTAARGYVIIGLMISAGIALRQSAVPRDYLAVAYIVMGGSLLLASVRFYRRFVRAAFSGESQRKSEVSSLQQPPIENEPTGEDAE